MGLWTAAFAVPQKGAVAKPLNPEGQLAAQSRELASDSGGLATIPAVALLR